MDSLMESAYASTEYLVDKEREHLPINPQNSVASFEEYPLFKIDVNLDKPMLSESSLQDSKQKKIEKKEKIKGELSPHPKGIHIFMKDSFRANDKGRNRKQFQ